MRTTATGWMDVGSHDRTVQRLRPTRSFGQLRADDLMTGRGGEQQRYRDFLTDARNWLENYFFWKVSDVESRDHLVSLTLLAVHAKRHTYDPRFDVADWLRAIADYRIRCAGLTNA